MFAVCPSINKISEDLGWSCNIVYFPILFYLLLFHFLVEEINILIHKQVAFILFCFVFDDKEQKYIDQGKHEWRICR